MLKRNVLAALVASTFALPVFAQAQPATPKQHAAKPAGPAQPMPKDKKKGPKFKGGKRNHGRPKRSTD